ncbi:alkaline phosphatase family protein [Virgibacillus sp. CBA3643]|uniref:alkaline phosphatase family protein n=1 Tax=Virgibacillus sp. CBA3643 TaxID=2942278 RepID=UPI0035A2B572
MGNQKVIIFGVDGLIPELVYRFAEQGFLPNISRMMKKGATSKLLPFISTWGDVNWVSFLTGQHPGNSWKGQMKPPSNKGNLLGITDELGKKCALVHFPQSVSIEDTSHFSFAPFYGGKGAPSFELASSMVFSTNLSKWPDKEKKESLGWPPAGSIAHHEKNNLSLIDKFDNQFHFIIYLNNGDEKEIFMEPLDKNQIRLFLKEDQFIDIEVNHWSKWINLNFNNGEEGSVRFKLAKYDEENGEIDLIQSQINKIEGLGSEKNLESYLIEECGPFVSSWTVKASPDELYYETSYEEGEYQAMWLSKAALGLLNDKNFDLFATVFRLNDETHHTSLGQSDPSSPFYSKEHSWIYEKNIRKSYEVLDRAVGKLLDEKKDNTTLILASDHGDVPNEFFCDINIRLQECGLCKLDDNSNPIYSESKAYLKDDRGGLEVFVNLEGREKSGIVPLEEYKIIQDRIFHALNNWTHTVNSNIKNVTATTLKKQDASIIGYWGEEMGDVIFTYEQGYVWGTNKKDSIAPVSFPGANHGPQKPTAKTSYASNQGIIIFHGENNKEGYKHNQEITGPYLMSDVGKTILNILGASDTPTIDGRLMSRLFRN